MTDDVTALASYRHTIDRIGGRWSAFLERRAERLQQHGRFGGAAEKVAEDIVQDLFTEVLDWSVGDLNNQVRNADILLTRLSVKHLLVEVKRPGALAWNRRAVDSALDQAHRYADEQKVRCIAVSDGSMLYAADIANGGRSPRVFAKLDAADAPLVLWWLSVQGIWRPRVDNDDAVLPEHPATSPAAPSGASGEGAALLHPKYKIPCGCFAYVGDAGNPVTWKPPYLHADGSIDIARLPKAIQSILSNYRGATVHAVPETAVPDVLLRLTRAAASLGRLPQQCSTTAPIYAQLVAALDQFDRESEIRAILEASASSRG